MDIDLRPVLFLIGVILLAVAGVMTVPACVDAFQGHSNWIAFAVAAMVTGGTALLLLLSTRSEFRGRMARRQIFLLTTLSWISVIGFATLPFLLADIPGNRLGLADAFFEAASGLTTTGSTVITGLDRLPAGILLWRALLQWMGGIGIIVTAVAILPVLRVGGMQLFQTESSDRSEKIAPRAQQIATSIGAVYVGLTLLCGLVYWIAGMSAFDAVAHAMTTIATAGFSTYDASMGHFGNPAIEWAATVFMLAGGIPFVLYIQSVSGKPSALFRNRQVRTYLAFVVAVILLLSFWLWIVGDRPLADAVRLVAFNTVSVLTTTGYVSTDYAQWGGFATGLFFLLMFVGGCTGSTAGGIKIFRFEILSILMRTYTLRLLYPSGIFERQYGGRPVSDDVIGSVVAFLFAFILAFAALTLMLSALRLDFVTSVSGAATALANVGPGLGPIIGPAGTFAPLPDAAKWMLSFGMILGRLELFTVLVLFTRHFWRG